MTTDTAVAVSSHDTRELVGFSTTALAAKQVYGAAGVCPSYIDVVKLNACIAHNELITYEVQSMRFFVSPNEFQIARS